jgi:transposase InsO family protein
MAQGQFVTWVGIHGSRYYDWKKRYGKVNEHNSWIPRDHWLQDWEKRAIVKFAESHPLDGYRRITFMMLDQDIVAVSASSTYRVLRDAGLLQRWNRTTTSKGTGFKQPEKPHDHWHMDIAYLNIRGTFYYLCSVLDGCSRYIVHSEIRESMREADVELVLQRARERFPEARPRIITDNGPQFIARDFKSFIRIAGMSHVRTSPYYPQSNGKIERWHKTIKGEAIRVKTPLSVDDARRIVAEFVAHYNTVRLHSAIGYITPTDRLNGRHKAIAAARDAKLEAAREARRATRAQKRISNPRREPRDHQPAA